jgi:hypothetical protein
MAVSRVTTRTPVRRIGDLSLARWRMVLDAADSPMLAAVEAVVAAASPHGAMCLAQAFKESSLGKDATAGQTNNPFGIMVFDGAHDCLPVFGGALCLRRFPGWAAAATNFRNRLATVQAPYEPEDITLEEYLATYVGGPKCRSTGGNVCANGETWVPGGDRNAGTINLYIWQTIDRLNEWLGVIDGDLIPEAGSLVTVAGAVARSRPTRGADAVHRPVAGERLATDGFTEGGESVAGSARWYRLAAGGGWVHSSGGAYTPGT